MLQNIAYFSMEIALDPAMPTYAGGLGILAGDTLRAAADMHVPMVGVSLVHRKGYFRQRLDAGGRQVEQACDWVLEDFLEELPVRVPVEIEGRQVLVRAWKRDVVGIGRGTVPVYLLDTHLPENGEWDRTLTHWLYGGDARYRLAQEVVLGAGGVRMLRELGYGRGAIRRFHMNEGHSSLLALELLDEEARESGRSSISRSDIEAVRAQCVFTTHTPVAAGHDQFPMDLVLRVLGRRDVYEMRDVFCCDAVLNMTYLALNLSHYVNGVAKRHGQVAQHMFAGYTVEAITNGVHVPTWTAPPFARLYDRHIPGWREDPFSLRYALGIPPAEVWAAHEECKQALIAHASREAGAAMDPGALTLGFARRMTAYKRPDLILRDPARLVRFAERCGRLQIIFAGKAHPRDSSGQELIRRVLEAGKNLSGPVQIVFLEEYGMALASLLTSGADVWLNTPEPPLEASGTSGMKAALNGVPSLSVLDGWWVEGCMEGLTGWAVGTDGASGTGGPVAAATHADLLYEKLEREVGPTYHDDRARFIEIMRHTIALNGSFFNAQRMLQQYVLKAYLI